MRIGIAVLVIAASVATFTKPDQVFVDAAHHVSFNYPAGWTNDTERNFYNPAAIKYTGNENSSGDPIVRNAIANVGFGGSEKNKETPYPNTNFSGAQFFYTVDPSLTSGQCKNIVPQSAETPAPTQETIQGITYWHNTTSEAGMCHSSEDEVWSTSRPDGCYLFDASIEMLCPGVLDNARDITPAEIDHVRKQLRSVMLSVRFNAPKR